MNRAFIFPGQGSQIVGMGKDFLNSFSEAQETFKIVDDALGYKLSDIIFNGPEDELTLTINTQPALMVVSVAILNVIKKQTGKDIKNLCSFVAGHSLGEYSALCGAGSISLEDTAKLLQIRGRSMQEACPIGKGAMAACIGINLSDLENIISGSDCDIANDNIEGQIVISGDNDIIDKKISILKDLGFKAIKLKVSAPFHSRLMKPAEIKMASALEQTAINLSIIPVIANVTAKPVIDPGEIKRNLVTQVCGRVRWRETLEFFAQQEIEEIIEIGSGKILTGMIKKTDYQFKCTNIGTVKEFEEFLNR